MIAKSVADLMAQHCEGKGGVATCFGDQRMGFDSNNWKKGDRAEAFFQSIGYREFYDIDYNGKATYNLDLGKPFPPKFEESVDLLFDGGCAEHVPNIFQAFENAWKMVKVGGCFIAQNPINQFDKCYWNINPEFHLAHLPANGFEMLHIGVVVNLNLPGQAAFLLQRLLPKKTVSAVQSSSSRSKTRLVDWAFSVNRNFEISPHSKLWEVMKSIFVPENTSTIVIARKVRPFKGAAIVDQEGYDRQT